MSLHQHICLIRRGGSSGVRNTIAIVIISLLLFGGDAVKNFSIAMFIGIIIGTYSSIFVASSSLSYFGIKRPEESQSS